MNKIIKRGVTGAVAIGMAVAAILVIRKKSEIKISQDAINSKIGKARKWFGKIGTKSVQGITRANTGTGIVARCIVEFNDIKCKVSDGSIVYLMNVVLKKMGTALTGFIHSTRDKYNNRALRT